MTGRQGPLYLANLLADLAEPGSGTREAAIAIVVANRSGEAITVGMRMIVSAGNRPLGSIHPVLDSLIAHEGEAGIAEKRSRLRSFRIDGDVAEMVGVDGGSIDVYFEVLARPPRLIVVGAGHIAVPLARVAALADFEVFVIDDRPEFGSRERFPDASELLVGPYAEMLKRVEINRDTFVVLVTRGHVHDQACLELVLDSPASYVGMIGSKHRVRTVMRHLIESGYDAEQLRRVYAPVGIDIAAQTPAEIAIAIMAEIINVRRGGKAPSLALGERLRV